MRIEPQKLVDITGYKIPSAQVRWFKDYLGAEVPRDRRGPIISENTLELLMARRMGLLASPTLPSATALLPEARAQGPKLLKRVKQ